LILEPGTPQKQSEKASGKKIFPADIAPEAITSSERKYESPVKSLKNNSHANTLLNDTSNHVS
jgi:hypothetical protein